MRVPGQFILKQIRSRFVQHREQIADADIAAEFRNVSQLPEHDGPAHRFGLRLDPL